MPLGVFPFFVGASQENRAMAETVVLVAQPRTESGTRASWRLRRNGLVPAVIYGHKEATVSLAVPGEELTRAIRHGSRILDIRQGEATERALIRDLQWDPFGQEILHVDFTRVGADEK